MTATIVDIDDVRTALEAAATVMQGINGSAAIAQRDLKSLTVLAADALCRRAGFREPGRPLVIHANRLPEAVGRRLTTKPERSECMVDVHISRRNRGSSAEPYETLVTAESEGYLHGVKKGSTSADCDYLWDLYKLLQVPSRVRLFVARARPQLVPVLVERIEHLVDAYLPRDQAVFWCVIPATSANGGSMSAAEYGPCRPACR